MAPLSPSAAAVVPAAEAIASALRSLAMLMSRAYSLRRALERRVEAVPADIDAEIARLKLRALGVQLDELTSEQREYLASWEIGT